MLEIIKVKSSVLEKIGYDDGTLYVKFKNNGWYKCSQVPETIFENFAKAPSKGEFLNRNIKPQYFWKHSSNPEH